MCRCCRRGRRTRPRAPARPHAWHGQGAGAEARPEGEAHCGVGRTQAAHDTPRNPPRRVCWWTRARTACPPGNHPTTPSRCCSGLWLGKCKGHTPTQPLAGGQGGWRGDALHAADVSEGGRGGARGPAPRSRPSQWRAPTDKSVLLWSAEGRQAPHLCCQSGTPAPPLRQHCPAHAHCHVCCPSARRRARRHAAAPLGSGVAPAARSRALAKGLRPCVCHPGKGWAHGVRLSEKRGTKRQSATFSDRPPARPPARQKKGRRGGRGRARAPCLVSCRACHDSPRQAPPCRACAACHATEKPSPHQARTNRSIDQPSVSCTPGARASLSAVQTPIHHRSSVYSAFSRHPPPRRTIYRSVTFFFRSSSEASAIE